MAGGNIREYTDPVKGIDPSSAGANSFKELGDAQRRDAATIGNAIGGVVQNVGQFGEQRQKAAEQDELNKLQTTFALRELNTSGDWDETIAKSDPNNSSTGTSFLEKQYAEIDKLVEAATTPAGKAWATKEATRQKIALAKSVRADMSTIAGYNAVTNIETSVNAKAAFLKSNPEQLDEALSGAEATIGNAIPVNADAKLRAKALAEETLRAKQLYVKAALSSAATTAPEQFMKDWVAGKYVKYAKDGLIDPQTDFMGLAKTAADAKSRAANAQATADEKAQRDAVDNAITKIYASLYNPDGSVNHANVAKAHMAFINDLPNVPGFTKTDFSVGQDYIDKVEAGTNRANVDDRTVVEDFQKRMNSVDRPLTEAEVYRAEQNGFLTPGTRAAIINEHKALHPTDKPEPLANVVDRQTYDANLALMKPEETLIGGIKIPQALQGKPNATAIMTAADDAYKAWYRQSFLNGINAGFKAADLLYPGGKAYIDPHKYTGTDPAKLLKAADEIVKQAPVVFPTGTKAPAAAVPVPGGAAVPPSALPRNPDGTLKVTVPGLLPGAR